jgi:aryl carrier-like protein
MSVDDKIAALSPQRAALLRELLAEREAALQPGSDLERLLCAQWGEVFARPVGPMDDFFQLGGDSIVALRLAARLHAYGWALRGSQLFAHPTIRQLAPQLRPVVQVMAPASATAFDVPLTPMQQGILFQVQTSSRPEVYLSQFQCEFPAGLDLPRFRQAWQRLTQARSALRACVYFDDDGRPAMRVAADVVAHIDVHDWCDWPLDTVAPALSALAQAERGRAFDLEAAPLSRVVLVRQPGGSWACLWTHHHLLLDGWSQLVLLETLFRLYADPLLTLPDDGVAVRAFAASQPSRLDEAAVQYWQSRFEGSMRSSFGPDQPGDAPVEVACGELPSAQAIGLARLARDHGVSLASALELAWGLVVAAALGRDDIGFGLVAATRPASVPGVEHLAWMCINTVPVRWRFDANLTARQALAGQASQALQRMERQADPLPEVLRRWPGAGFGSVLVIENFHAGVADSIAKLAADLPPSHVRFSVREHHPVVCVVSGNEGDGLELEIKVDRAWRVPLAAQTWLAALREACARCAAAPDQPLAELLVALRGVLSEERGRG